jgi:EAL domain-containing protein (putative c-di-GMP-specific phosphodiesterase class I)/DNA-binding response OmpR family regulator
MRATSIPDSRFRDASIVIVDDELSNVRLLEAIFRSAGYRNVLSTTDPRAAGRLVASATPAVMLLDLLMPEMDGFAVLEELRGSDSPAADLPVLVLTADVRPEVKRRALGSGAEDFVTKPFDPQEVLLRTHNLLETALLHQDLSSHNRRLSELVAVRSAELAAAREAHASILASLARFHEAGSPEETAAALCSELVTRAGFEAVAIQAFVGDWMVVPLAAAGGRFTPALLGRPFPPGRGRYLRERAEQGPWAEEWTEEWAEDIVVRERRLRTFGDEVRVAMYAPLTSGGRTLGLLTVGSGPEVPVDEFSRRLPTVVDYAAIANALLAPALVSRVEHARSRHAVMDIIDEHRFVTVFQPIVRLDDGGILGYEALTRFEDGTPPDMRFTEAHALGVGVELEEATMRAALRASSRLPSGAWLSLNASPDLLLQLPRLYAGFRDAGRPIVLEVTEHVPIAEYGSIRVALAQAGADIRLSIDDAGAGFNSFRHIVELNPDFVKLDVGIVRSIEDDPMRQALVTGLNYFATKTGCTLIAEGIETERERAALLALGVTVGQGYLTGRPLALLA